MTTDWGNAYQEIEDILFPHYNLDVWERALYYYLLRHTKLHGVESATIPLSQIVTALNLSESKAREAIRSLDKKGCIQIEQTKHGHIVRVLLPQDLGLKYIKPHIPEIDLEQIDFFKNREYIEALRKREQGRCFYCLKEISKDNCELDHVVSQVNRGDNSYRNIVATCHRCNTQKGDEAAESYIRSLFRKNLLSETEFEDRIKAVNTLRAGELKPDI